MRQNSANVFKGKEQRDSKRRTCPIYISKIATLPPAKLYFVSADIYFEGYIIYVIGKGFKQVLEFQAPYYFDQCVGQLKKKKIKRTNIWELIIHPLFEVFTKFLEELIAHFFSDGNELHCF